jgi:hypothetical protein
MVNEVKKEEARMKAKLAEYAVLTPTREVFNGPMNVKLAALVFIRCGRNMTVARDAWRRMMPSLEEADEHRFEDLVARGIDLLTHETLALEG